MYECWDDYYEEYYGCSYNEAYGYDDEWYSDYDDMYECWDDYYYEYYGCSYEEYYGYDDEWYSDYSDWYADYCDVMMYDAECEFLEC